MDINLEYYKTFYYVAKYGSTTKAADKLYNNQPNVTRSIKNLEKLLGCRLFERSNRGMKLTCEGQVLYERVKLVIKELELAMKDLEDLKQLEKGSIAIATTEIALHGILLSVLKKYRREYPNIKLTISNQTTTDALRSVRDGEADIALVTGISQADELDMIHLRDFEEVPVCSEAYEELLGCEVSLEAISRYPIVALNENTVHYKFYEELFCDKELVFKADIQTASIDQILPVVACDLGVGFIPEFYYREVSNYTNIRKIKLLDKIPTRGIFLVKRKNIFGSVAVRRMEEQIMSLFHGEALENH